MKKVFALLLCLVTIASLFTGCSEEPDLRISNIFLSYATPDGSHRLHAYAGTYDTDLCYIIYRDEELRNGSVSPAAFQKILDAYEDTDLSELLDQSEELRTSGNYT